MRPATAGLAAALAVLGGCAHGSTIVRSASRGSPARAALEDVPVCGFPVEVTVTEGVGVVAAREVEGELIAATPTELWILGDDGLVHVPAAGARVRVTIVPSTGVALGFLTAVGSVSTLSHGFYLVFSLPLWLGAGISSATHAARGSFAIADGPDRELAAWARFPQGPPPGWPSPGAAPRRCAPTSAEGFPRTEPDEPPPASKPEPADAE